LQGEAPGSVAQLREMFADPLLVGELPGDQELIEVAEAAPNVATGILKLFRAYREQSSRLKDLSGLLSGQGHMAALSDARLPMDEVREVLESRPHYFAGIDEAAEAFHARLSPGDDLAGALKGWLRREHGLSVRALPVHVMPDLRRRFDRHSMRLFLSERLSAQDQLREIAMEAAQIAFPEAIAADLDQLAFSTGEARRIGRFELARYAAHAIMMPYAAFLAAAQRAKYDLDVLSARFQVSFEQAASRLVTLQRPAASAVPFFLMEIDHAGHRLRKSGAQGFPQARFGGNCPKLNIHAAFAQVGQILADRIDVFGGGEFLVLARTIDGPHANFQERIRRTAILIGCDAAHAQETVYGEVPLATIAGGTACRLCERQGCLARAEPPVTRPLGLDEMVTGLSAFDFQ
jgi:predicted transcriptional regulator